MLGIVHGGIALNQGALIFNENLDDRAGFALIVAAEHDDLIAGADVRFWLLIWLRKLDFTGHGWVPILYWFVC
jgi:hypothetical protein